MKNLWIFLTIILLVMPLVGCSNSGDLDYYEVLPLNFLDGTWKSSFNEIFIFAADTLEHKYDTTQMFTAKIHEIGSWSSDNTSGIVIIEYTWTTDDTGWGSPWAKNPVGLDFTAVYFTNKTVNSVELASAADVNYQTPTKASVAAVRLYFTVHNVGTYFNNTSACEKQ